MHFKICSFQLCRKLASRDSVDTGISSEFQRFRKHPWLQQSRWCFPSNNFTMKKKKSVSSSLRTKTELKIQSLYSGSRPELPRSSLSLTEKDTQENHRVPLGTQHWKLAFLIKRKYHLQQLLVCVPKCVRILASWDHWGGMLQRTQTRRKSSWEYIRWGAILKCWSAQLRFRLRAQGLKRANENGV